MTCGLFVSAIGTDCGKTHVAAALLRQLVLRGHSPVALKPLMSGHALNDLASSDAGRLLLAAGQPVTSATIENICWKRFEEPIAPNVAARRAGISLDYCEMLQFIRSRVSSTEATLVEGAGGVMSPLTDDRTNLDLMVDLKLPVLLVATSYLGAVSHTLTALAALAERAVAVAALVINQPLLRAGSPSVFAEEMARWTPIPIVIAPFSHLTTEDNAWVNHLSGRLFP